MSTGTIPVIGLTTEQIAREVALDLPDASYVNLGIGFPQLVAGHIPDDAEVVLHAENGILGFGPHLAGQDEDPNLIDAGKAPIAMRAGASLMSHTDSFALIRGKHLDYCVLGAYQVAANGDLANWWTGEGMPGVGGAMDLCRGARAVFIFTRHLTRDGQPKLLRECSFPLTARQVARRVYTELGIFRPLGDSFEIVGIADGVSVSTIRQHTAAPLREAELLHTLPRQ